MGQNEKSQNDESKKKAGDNKAKEEKKSCCKKISEIYEKHENHILGLIFLAGLFALVVISMWVKVSLIIFEDLKTF